MKRTSTTFSRCLTFPILLFWVTSTTSIQPSSAFQVGHTTKRRLVDSKTRVLTIGLPSLQYLSFFSMTNPSITSSTTALGNKRPHVEDGNDSEGDSNVSNKKASGATLVSSTTESFTTSSTILSSERLQNAKEIMIDRISGMNQRAKEEKPFNDLELKMIMESVQNLRKQWRDENSVSIDEDETELPALLLQVAHLSHKNWTRTELNGKLLGNALRLQNLSDGTPSTRYFLKRILKDGNWDGAHTFAQKQQQQQQISTGLDTNENEICKPWAVLVTGVNGIRKTTSIYQSWFPELLQEALVVPGGKEGDKNSIHLNTALLPVGNNTFFRQLDHMIATICNADFSTLYRSTKELLQHSDGMESGVPSPAIVKLYSDLKGAIFTRYRTISELLGAHLLHEAKKGNLNCMLETSGRDVAMFHYIDHFFPLSYRKLALHFTINDLSQAQVSVDQRMIHEIQSGIKALDTGLVLDIIQANEGGPYGSEVLPGVQSDSDRVWNDLIMNQNDDKENVGSDWYKASIQINAHPNKPWTAQAIKPDGTYGTIFTFEPRS